MKVNENFKLKQIIKKQTKKKTKKIKNTGKKNHLYKVENLN